jgi:CRP/FNR family transcriptional regulator, cyclic AMP receptor protein
MTPKAVAKKAREFDPNTFLATIGKGRNSALFLAKQGIFAQGDAADAVFCLQKGKVKLTVVSKAGKEATIGILGEGDFFGEGGLAGQFVRRKSHDGSASSGARIFRSVRGLFVRAEHPLRSRSG